MTVPAFKIEIEGIMAIDEDSSFGGLYLDADLTYSDPDGESEVDLIHLNSESDDKDLAELSVKLIHLVRKMYNLSPVPFRKTDPYRKV